MKLYSVMCVLAFGAFCYIIVEIRQLRKVIAFEILSFIAYLKYFSGSKAESTGA